eukprot:881905-Rhodomonas_salina.4
MTRRQRKWRKGGRRRHNTFREQRTKEGQTKGWSKQLSDVHHRQEMSSRAQISALLALVLAVSHTRSREEKEEKEEKEAGIRGTEEGKSTSSTFSASLSLSGIHTIVLLPKIPMAPVLHLPWHLDTPSSTDLT